MSRERQERRRHHREEQERIESEISLLERRLTSLRLQLQVNQREQQTQADDLYGEEGIVTKVSRGNHFIYFRLTNSTVRYRGPQNLLVIPNQQDE